MQKLVVMYSENRKNPTNTWSGTSYSLRQALAENVEIIFVDLHEGKVLRLLDLLSIKVGKKHRSYVFGPLHDKLLQIKANYLLRDYKSVPVLEIANELKIRSPYYLYQDLSLVVLPEIQESLKKKGILSCGGLRMELSDGEMKRKIQVQKDIYFSATKSFFMGKWVEKKMKKIYPEVSDRFLSVGGGINKEFVRKTNFDNLKEKLILFVGIDFERKGGKIVLDAFKILKKKIDNVKLIIAGPEKESVPEKNIDGVEILGNINRKKLSDIFSKASLFCMPSEFEAYGLVFPEALSFGVPCIGRNAYEMQYFIREGENGYLLKEDKAEALSEIMYKILNDADMKSEVEKNVEYIRREYSWSRVADDICKVIYKVK